MHTIVIHIHIYDMYIHIYDESVFKKHVADNYLVFNRSTLVSSIYCESANRRLGGANREIVSCCACVHARELPGRNALKFGSGCPFPFFRLWLVFFPFSLDSI